MNSLPVDVQLKPHSSKWYMRIFEKFRPNFWITLNKTIYHPSKINPESSMYEYTLKHELVHVRQQQEDGFIWFSIKYLFLPLPIFFAYFRWKYEREAYMVQIMSMHKNYRNLAIEKVIKNLWKYYIFTWPKSSMRKWFHKEIERRIK